MSAVLPAGERPPTAGAWSASLAFAWRALLKLKHVPEQLADVIGIPILFTLMFTYLFGGALADSTDAYLQFLLPGTLVMAVLLVTVYTGVTLNGDIASGAFDRFRCLPIWRPAPIVGSLLGDVGRYVLASTLVVGLGLAMGYRPDGGPLGVTLAVAVVVVFAVSLSWIWIVFALVVRTPAAVQTAGLLVLFPLTFVSNVFVDPRTMPSWVRTLAEDNPMSHVVTAARELTAGSPAGADVIWVLVAAGAMNAAFIPLAMWRYRRAP